MCANAGYIARSLLVHSHSCAHISEDSERTVFKACEAVVNHVDRDECVSLIQTDRGVR
jgi:hypothetical protein